MSGLTVAFMVGAAAGLVGVLCWRGYRRIGREVRYGTGAKVRRNIALATELGVPRAAQQEFCRGMWDAERTMAERGYCEARRDAGVMQRHPRTGYEHGFLRWLDDFAAGMPTAPGRCNGVANWEGCRLCRWSCGPRIAGNPGESWVRDAMQQGEGE